MGEWKAKEMVLCNSHCFDMAIDYLVNYKGYLFSLTSAKIQFGYKQIFMLISELNYCELQKQQPVSGLSHQSF